MAVLTVLTYPNKKLREKALPLTLFDANTAQFAADMLETMYHDSGVGLAATQVGVAQRIIVMDVSEDKTTPICAINPEIIASEGIQYEYEGCLSVPEAYDKVERAAKVTLKAQDQYGEFFELEAEGLLAICIQHEIDHLNGVLFIDHLSKLKQQRIQKKYEKYLKALALEE